MRRILPSRRVRSCALPRAPVGRAADPPVWPALLSFELPPSPVPVVPTVQTSDVPFPLQNFVYAFQWWLFALFGVVVYLRWLWLETRRSHDPAGDAPAGEVQASTPIR